MGFFEDLQKILVDFETSIMAEVKEEIAEEFAIMEEKPSSEYVVPYMNVQNIGGILKDMDGVNLSVNAVVDKKSIGNHFTGLYPIKLPTNDDNNNFNNLNELYFNFDSITKHSIGQLHVGYDDNDGIMDSFDRCVLKHQFSYWAFNGFGEIYELEWSSPERDPQAHTTRIDNQYSNNNLFGPMTEAVWLKEISGDDLRHDNGWLSSEIPKNEVKTDSWERKVTIGKTYNKYIDGINTTITEIDWRYIYDEDGKPDRVYKTGIFRQINEEYTLQWKQNVSITDGHSLDYKLNWDTPLQWQSKEGRNADGTINYKEWFLAGTHKRWRPDHTTVAVPHNNDGTSGKFMMWGYNRTPGWCEIEKGQWAPIHQIGYKHSGSITGGLVGQVN